MAWGPYIIFLIVVPGVILNDVNNLNRRDIRYRLMNPPTKINRVIKIIPNRKFMEYDQDDPVQVMKALNSLPDKPVKIELKDVKEYLRLENARLKKQWNNQQQSKINSQSRRRAQNKTEMFRRWKEYINDGIAKALKRKKRDTGVDNTKQSRKMTEYVLKNIQRAIHRDERFDPKKRLKRRSHKHPTPRDLIHEIQSVPDIEAMLPPEYLQKHKHDFHKFSPSWGNNVRKIKNAGKDNREPVVQYAEMGSMKSLPRYRKSNDLMRPRSLPELTEEQLNHIGNSLFHITDKRILGAHHFPKKKAEHSVYGNLKSLGLTSYPDSREVRIKKLKKLIRETPLDAQNQPEGLFDRNHPGLNLLYENKMMLDSAKFSKPKKYLVYGNLDNLADRIDDEGNRYSGSDFRRYYLNKRPERRSISIETDDSGYLLKRKGKKKGTELSWIKADPASKTKSKAKKAGKTIQVNKKNKRGTLHGENLISESSLKQKKKFLNKNFEDGRSSSKENSDKERSNVNENLIDEKSDSKENSVKEKSNTNENADEKISSSKENPEEERSNSNEHTGKQRGDSNGKLVNPVSDSSNESIVKKPKKTKNEIKDHFVYGNIDNDILGIRYNDTPYRLPYTDFRKHDEDKGYFNYHARNRNWDSRQEDETANTINEALNAIRNSNRKNRYRYGRLSDSMAVLPGDLKTKDRKYRLLKHYLDDQASEFENDANELVDFYEEDLDFIRRSSGRNKYASYEKHEGKNGTVFCDDVSTSSSSSNSGDKNPGNPYTIFKSKYKQNWLWNHFMDGNHMNINPYGPKFDNLGPTGNELFFGRKWWYFNQDDYKPFRRR